MGQYGCTVPVPAAARVVADARLVNSGQSGIAAKRFIVVEAVADQFVDGFMRELHHGE